MEDVVVGFAIGSAMAIPVQIIAGLTRQRWLAVALPLLVAVVLVAVPATRARIRAARWEPVAWWFGPAVGLVSLVALVPFGRYAARNDIDWAGGAGVPHIDLYLHQALAGQLLTRGPTGWPMVLGENLGYHWFTHAWVAQVAAASGVEINLVLLRLLPAVVSVAVPASVAVAGMRLASGAGLSRPAVGVVAAVVTYLGGKWVPFGYGESWGDLAFPVAHDSPTLALGARCSSWCSRCGGAGSSGGAVGWWRPCSPWPQPARKARPCRSWWPGSVWRSSRCSSGGVTWR